MDGITFNHPKEGMKGSVRIGGLEVVTFVKEGVELKSCQVYPLIKMKCWKVGYMVSITQETSQDIISLHISHL